MSQHSSFAYQTDCQRIVIFPICKNHGLEAIPVPLAIFMREFVNINSFHIRISRTFVWSVV